MVVGRLADAGVLPAAGFPAEAFHELRERVHAAFDVPETSITPMMSRTLFALAASLRPRRVVGVGTYAGNALVWLAGPGLCRPPLCDEPEVLGCDIDAGATELARSNFRRLDAQAGVDLVCADGLDVLAASAEPIDLLYLDADRPEDRKGIYLPLLEAALPRLRPGSVVLAHDVLLPLFAEHVRGYLERVRDPDAFRVSVPLPVDDCGLELTIR
jgi:predicted O-methyltransferase YrrM